MARGLVVSWSWRAGLAMYHVGMSRLRLLESPAPSSDDDVEPYFPEPTVELDVDSLE